MGSEHDVLLAHVAADQGEVYRPGFYHWLRDNADIWKRFAAEANKLRAQGRSHYGARTIAEFLRHETALRESPELKLNNNQVPSLARLYMRVYECPGFFELRGL